MNGRAAFEVDTAVYGLEALLRTAYKFTDRCYVFVESIEGSNRVAVAIAPKSSNDLQSILGEFYNELLDQRIRESLAQEYGDLRTMIVAQAFAEGNLLDRNRDDGDYQADPLGICRRR